MDRLRFLLLFSTLGLGACESSSSTAIGVTPATAVAVDPAQFLGDVKCGTESGDMLLFVATLADVSPKGELGIGDTPLVLPSSNPTSCHVTVLFEGVLDGREYEAAVDGYDRTDIQPLSKGSQTMVVSSTGEYAPPRWKTKCGHHRLPPTLKSAEGGVPADSGAIETPDSGYHVDGGYAECRPVVHYGANDAPWLEGPVCALTQLTIAVRGCDALRQEP